MNLDLDLSLMIPQLKEARAILVAQKDEIQRQYDSYMDAIEGDLKHFDGLIKRYTKAIPSSTPSNESTTPASPSARTEPPAAPTVKESAPPPPQAEAKPPRKKPGPPKGFRKGVPKKPRPETPTVTLTPVPTKLKVDEVTTKEIVPPTPVKVDPIVTESTVPPSVPPPSANKGLPPGVTLGRNGRPRITEAVAFVLKTYGQLHLDVIVKKLDEHDMLPNSGNPRAYVGFEMSKNKDLFRPVKSKGKKKKGRGFWTLAPKYEAALAKDAVEVKTPVDPELEAEPEPVEASDVEETDDDEPEVEAASDDSDLKDIREFRASEASVTVTDDDEVAKLVDEMTDPARLNGTAAA